MTTTEYAPVIAVAIQTVVFLFGGGAMVLRTSGDLTAMKEELKKLAAVITTQAVQQQRLNEQSRRMTMLEQRIEDMRRGKGYVQDRDVNVPLDREY